MRDEGHLDVDPLLVLAAVYALAAVAMQAIVHAVAAARVPFASASAAMVVVLEVAFPAIALDESAAACAARATATYDGFDDAWTSSLPPSAVLLVGRRGGRSPPDGGARTRYLARR